MAAIRFVNRIDGKHPDAIDAERVERSGRSDHFVDWGFGDVDGKGFVADLFRSFAGRLGRRCDLQTQKSLIELLWKYVLWLCSVHSPGHNQNQGLSN